MDSCTVALHADEHSAGKAVRHTQSQGGKARQLHVPQAATTGVCCCMHMCTLALHTGKTKLKTLCRTYTYKGAKYANHKLYKLQ